MVRRGFDLVGEGGVTSVDGTDALMARCRDAAARAEHQGARAPGRQGASLRMVMVIEHLC